jgi:hypothetical protein
LINLDQIGPTAKIIALPAKWKTESAPARVIALIENDRGEGDPRSRARRGPRCCAMKRSRRRSPDRARRWSRSRRRASNYLDVYYRSGFQLGRALRPRASPTTPGAEASGTVVAVGAEVSEAAVGDRVAYAISNGQGSYAEFAAVASWH